MSQSDLCGAMKWSRARTLGLRAAGERLSGHCTQLDNHTTQSIATSPSSPSPISYSFTPLHSPVRSPLPRVVTSSRPLYLLLFLAVSSLLVPPLPCATSTMTIPPALLHNSQGQPTTSGVTNIDNARSQLVARAEEEQARIQRALLAHGSFHMLNRLAYSGYAHHGILNLQLDLIWGPETHHGPAGAVLEKAACGKLSSYPNSDKYQGIALLGRYNQQTLPRPTESDHSINVLLSSIPLDGVAVCSQQPAYSWGGWGELHIGDQEVALLVGHEKSHLPEVRHLDHLPIKPRFRNRESLPRCELTQTTIYGFSSSLPRTL